jgi:FtsZ-binding cell division protein ZapB
MTDITERLRLRNDPSQMLMCYPPRPAPDMLCYEAADEIERLQEEIQELKSDSTIFIIERGEAIGENADLREEIERLRAALRQLAEIDKIENGFIRIKEVIHYTRFMARAALGEASDDAAP